MIGALFAAMSTGPGALSGALSVARPVLRTALDRAYLAACLATGFRSPETDAHRAACEVVRAARGARKPAPSPASLSEEACVLLALQEHATRTVDNLGAVVPSAERAAIRGLAVQVQQRIVTLPVDDRAAVGVIIVRELIDDVSVRCVGLDRAVRDAARQHACLPTMERMEMAQTLVMLALRATFTVDAGDTRSAR